MAIRLSVIREQNDIVIIVTLFNSIPLVKYCTHLNRAMKRQINL